MRIKAFKAVRPPPSLARDVASLPYDVGELEDARKEAAANPKSFLHVERPEVDLPDGFGVGDDHASAAKHLALFRERGWLEQENGERLYLYRIQLGGHVQTGIIACCHVEDYWNNVIKKHEKTKKPVEDQRTEHVLRCNANTGPIFLLHRDCPTIEVLSREAAARDPLFDFAAADGIRHTVWTIADSDALVTAFRAVPCAYIADGHHRAASAGRAGIARREINRHHNGSEEYNWFLAVLFPASQLQILAYNRYVKDLNGLTAEQFLAKAREVFTVSEGATPRPRQPGVISMYLGGHWYGLSWTPDTNADPVSALDVSVLQSRLLGPTLGIDDPRTNSRIGYFGGFDAVEQLQRRVDSGQAAVAFSVHPTTVNQLMAISDAGQIMPPKSTWFEPKLRSGLFVHLLD